MFCTRIQCGVLNHGVNLSRSVWIDNPPIKVQDYQVEGGEAKSFRMGVGQGKRGNSRQRWERPEFRKVDWGPHAELAVIGIFNLCVYIHPFHYQNSRPASETGGGRKPDLLVHAYKVLPVRISERQGAAAWSLNQSSVRRRR